MVKLLNWLHSNSVLVPVYLFLLTFFITNCNDSTKDRMEKDTIYDEKTGLMWQDDQDTNSLKMTWSEAQNYCKTLAKDGYDDWRLPSIEELFTIVDNSKYNPSIDSRFSHIAIGSYWSSTKYSLDSSLPMGVNFYDGSDGIDYGTTPHYVRCVRGSMLRVLSFSRTANQVIIDNSNKLLWQDNEDVKTKYLTYDEAVNYCQNLNLSGVSGWRLPTISELRDIIDRKQEGIKLNQIFKNRVDGFVWSSTSYKPNNTKVWVILFNDGNDYQLDRDKKGYVRCVKDIQ